MVPVVLAQALIVTLFADLPSICRLLKKADSVLSGSKRKLSSVLIAIEYLIESKLAIFKKYIKRCDKKCACLFIGRQFLTSEGQIA